MKLPLAGYQGGALYETNWRAKLTRYVLLLHAALRLRLLSQIPAGIVWSSLHRIRTLCRMIAVTWLVFMERDSHWMRMFFRQFSTRKVAPACGRNEWLLLLRAQ